VIDVFVVHRPDGGRSGRAQRFRHRDAGRGLDAINAQLVEQSGFIVHA
jgi:hypothetical protein